MMQSFSFLLLCFFQILQSSGFDPSTLIYTSSGLQEIGTLKVGQSLIADCDNLSFRDVDILATTTKKVDFYVIIQAGSTRIVAAPQQLFYNAETSDWICGQHVQANQLLQTLYGSIVKVEWVEIISSPAIVTALAVRFPHTFAIGIDGILAHNEILMASTGAAVFCYLSPGALPVMTPLAALAVKTFSVALTSYASWIIAADVLKNIGGLSALKENILSLWGGIKSKFSGKKMHHHDVDDQLRGTCGTPLIPHQSAFPDVMCGGSLSPNQKVQSICPILDENPTIIVEGNCINITEVLGLQCPTSKQNKEVGLLPNNEIDQLENDQFLMRKNPGQKDNKELQGPSKSLTAPAGPHGTYAPAPYHGLKDTKKKSKAPQDGQTALDNSIEIIDNQGSPKKSRIAIMDDEFILLYFTLNHPTAGKLYHGFVVPWKKLPQDSKDTLKNAGMVRRNGKIIKK